MNDRPRQRSPRVDTRAFARGVAVLLALLGGASGMAGCKTTYNLEDRDTPTQVVVEAGGGAAAGSTATVVVYVADRKGFDGSVQLGSGLVREMGPTLSLRAGNHEVSVLVNGRAAARATASVKHRTWIVVRVLGDGATIGVQDEAPSVLR